MFGMLSVLAEFQRELIVANTRDGLPAARARGRGLTHAPRVAEYRTFRIPHTASRPGTSLPRSACP